MKRLLCWLEIAHAWEPMPTGHRKCARCEREEMWLEGGDGGGSYWEPVRGSDRPWIVGNLWLALILGILAAVFCQPFEPHTSRLEWFAAAFLGRIAYIMLGYLIIGVVYLFAGAWHLLAPVGRAIDRLKEWMASP